MNLRAQSGHIDASGTLITTAESRKNQSIFEPARPLPPRPPSPALLHDYSHRRQSRQGCKCRHRVRFARPCCLRRCDVVRRHGNLYAAVASRAGLAWLHGGPTRRSRCRARVAALVFVGLRETDAEPDAECDSDDDGDAEQEEPRTFPPPQLALPAPATLPVRAATLRAAVSRSLGR